MCSMSSLHFKKPKNLLSNSFLFSYNTVTTTPPERHSPHYFQLTLLFSDFRFCLLVSCFCTHSLIQIVVDFASSSFRFVSVFSFAQSSQCKNGNLAAKRRLYLPSVMRVHDLVRFILHTLNRTFYIYIHSYPYTICSSCKCHSEYNMR